MSTVDVPVRGAPPAQAPPLRTAGDLDRDTLVGTLCRDSKDDRGGRVCHILLPGSGTLTYCDQALQGGSIGIHAPPDVARSPCMCGRPRCKPCLEVYGRMEQGQA